METKSTYLCSAPIKALSPGRFATSSVTISATNASTFFTIEIWQSPLALRLRRFEQGLGYFKEIGQPWAIAVSYGHLGDVAAALRDFPEAEGCYLKRLKIFGERGQRWETIRTLFSIITVVEAQGRKEWAVELLALYFQQDGGIKMHNDEAERLRSRLQSELPQDVFAESYERGQALNFQQVLAELLI